MHSSLLRNITFGRTLSRFTITVIWIWNYVILPKNVFGWGWFLNQCMHRSWPNAWLIQENKSLQIHSAGELPLLPPVFFTITSVMKRPSPKAALKNNDLSYAKRNKVIMQMSYKNRADSNQQVVISTVHLSLSPLQNHWLLERVEMYFLF